MAKRTLAKIATADLERELQSRRERVPQLEKRRKELEAELASVNGELAALGGGAPPRRKPGPKPGSRRKKKATRAATRGTRGAARAERGGRKRPRNAANLAESLAKIMSRSEPRKVSDLITAVQKAGYRTSADNFATIVNQTLSKDPRFKRVSRGMYINA